MSKGDMTMINDEIVDDLEDYITDNQVYKNLRRRSASLAFILTIFLPILLFFFNIACTPRRTVVESFQHIYSMIVLDLDCLAIVLGWLLIQSIFFIPIRNKFYQPSDTISSYRRNGIVAFVFSLSGIYLLNWLNIIRASYVYDNIHKILLASMIVSGFISLLLYMKGTGIRHSKQINPIIAFFYGTDIDLTIAGSNLKLFFELRVGLIGWACLNLCFFLKTMELYTYRRLPACMLIVVQQILHALQLIWYEEDHRMNDNRKKETIGFIRIFGSLCWFPFLWCLPCQYLTLVNYPIKNLYIFGSIIVFIIGMFMYRASHNQQETSKKLCKKNVKSMIFNDEFIFLTSNHCCLYRHPYYLSYLLMLMSWSLPCGSASIPWMLPTYYLLVICHKSHSEGLVSH
ncbi:unnamed protein product [Rotaria sordida]|uniref:Uncharacterized protein n=1 Tax=Rotaria sordida TaxID=392033 RepID=A0A818KMC8_9BILA|nr:unnamed protein product [Rotaria sordida]CAF1049796.1 unnamed protein product [Rotaria sordida]CAF3496022.1 unnamed protein product [Rotaria sordida]CAF3558857.1 unnamed protein product [Rotaria sordida]